MTDNLPAETFPPGEYLRDEIAARGWTQTTLATILDKPLYTVNRIINGKKAITPEMAIKLGAAFGNSAQLWMNLETAWQLSEVRKRKRKRWAKPAVTNQQE